MGRARALELVRYTWDACARSVTIFSPDDDALRYSTGDLTVILSR